MDLSFLPKNILSAINFIDVDKLYEIRMRKDFYITVKYGVEKYYLSEDGVSKFSNGAIRCNLEDINEIINNVTERSIYAYTDKIKKGFLTYSGGIRIGLAGECVFEKEIVTIKNITSLNIRIPHEINGASNEIINYAVKNNDLYNSLIISPPFCGKTTILKDFAKKLDFYFNLNILMIDERAEFEFVKGEHIDLIKYCNKAYAFDCGVRSMSPDVVITDELSGIEDWKCVLQASLSGVKIIASCHGKDIEDVRNKECFINGVFDRYFVLSSNKLTPGVLTSVYDKSFCKIL